jgi:hypothetical protein
VSRHALFSLCILGLFPAVASAAKLQEQTVKAWSLYRDLTEKRIHAELDSGKKLLVQDFFPEGEATAVRRKIRMGEVYTHEMETRNEERGEIKIPDGLVHHWYGSVFIPNAKLEGVLRWVQDYDRHKDYFEAVEDSRLVAKTGDVFEIFLKLRRKKIVTAYFNTDHVVTYRRLGPKAVASTSVATRIAELEQAGTPREKEKAVGDDRGFLWRLNSYWRFLQEPDGVVVECEAISLSRGIPWAVRWLVLPFTKSVPKEFLESTLWPMREAFDPAHTAQTRSVVK